MRSRDIDRGAGQRKDHHQHLRDEGDEQRGFDRLSDSCEIERERRLAHAGR